MKIGRASERKEKRDEMPRRTKHLRNAEFAKTHTIILSKNNFCSLLCLEFFIFVLLKPFPANFACIWFTVMFLTAPTANSSSSFQLLIKISPRDAEREERKERNRPTVSLLCFNSPPLHFLLLPNTFPSPASQEKKRNSWTQQNKESYLKTELFLTRQGTTTKRFLFPGPSLNNKKHKLVFWEDSDLTLPSLTKNSGKRKDFSSTYPLPPPQKTSLLSHPLLSFLMSHFSPAPTYPAFPGKKEKEKSLIKGELLLRQVQKRGFNCSFFFYLLSVRHPFCFATKVLFPAQRYFLPQESSS